MASIGQRYGANRPQYHQRLYYTRRLPPNLIASIWPRGPRKRAHGSQRRNQEAFRAMMYLIKLLPGNQVLPWREILTQWNANHKGMKGSATIRLYDLLFMSLSGRLLAISWTSTQYAYHHSVRRQITQIFDWLEAPVGATLSRTDDGWMPSYNDKPGSIFTMTIGQPTPNCPLRPPGVETAVIP